MKCYNHPEKDSVGSCNGCNKGLCKECASIFNVPLCKPCYIVDRASTIRGVYGVFAFTLFYAGLGLLAAFSLGSSTRGGSIVIYIMWPILGGLSYLSWRFISRTISMLASKSVGWIVDIKTYVLYLFCKLLLSILISIVAGPLELIFLIRKWRVAKGEITAIQPA